MKKALVFGLVGVFAVSPEVRCEQAKRIPQTVRPQVVRPNQALTLRRVQEDLRAVEEVAEDDSQEAMNREGKGPKEQQIRLHELLVVEGLSDFGMAGLEDIANLSLVIYPDGNQDSGIFYYRPAHYFLHWTPEDQYFLSIDYKPEQASAKNVVIDARLTPGPVQDDHRVLERLLKTHLRTLPKEQQPPDIDQIVLLPLPARYEGLFDWRTWGVAPEDVTVTGVDPDTRQFGLQIQTDVATKELLLGKLADANGLTGDVSIVPQTVTPSQPALAPIKVTARLKLADNDAYNRAQFREAAGEYAEFRNEYDLPLILRHLTYLVEEQGRLKLRGYDLGAQKLLPRQVARIPNAKITPEIAAEGVIRSWYSFSLENDESFLEAILDGLTGGVGAIPVTDVDIQIVRGEELFAQYDIFKIVVVVRSGYFDPNPDSSGMIEKAYEFSPDSGSVGVAPLYRPEGAGGELYEFKIGVVTNDGSPHQDAEWRQPASGFVDNIFIGSSQIEEVLAE